MATSTPGRSTTHSFAFCPPPYGFFAWLGKVYLPRFPEPFLTLKTGYALPLRTSIQTGRTERMPRAAAESAGTKSIS